MNLILGGTYGLGWEIVQELKRQGEETFVVGRSYDVSKHGRGLACDIANESSVDKLIQYIGESLGKETLNFYWIAGYGYIGDFAEQPDPKAMISVNLANVLPLAQAVWQKMLQKQTAANFVVISSTTGARARANEAIYAATKHAQVGFTRSLGLESERLQSPIKVALFLPAGMQTLFWKGDEPANYDTFLNPGKVAAEVVARVNAQQDYYYEQTIERGSL